MVGGEHEFRQTGSGSAESAGRDPGELIELHFTSEPANLARVRDVAQNIAASYGFGKVGVHHVVLALDEALTNVIRHGYEGRRGCPIDVTLGRCREPQAGIVITVCDCGRQVDPDSIVGRDLEEVCPGGLGTHIIRSVMDEVEYARREPEGMRLRMVKYLRDETVDNSPEDATNGA